MDKTKHIIINGDSRKMAELAEQSVHLIVTSPPYWQLIDYGDARQIGFNDSYEEYINNLNLVWKECFRVLHDGCRLCINIGDQFARSVYYGRYKVIPIHSEIIRICEALGLDFMGQIIWQKTTTTNTTGGGAVMGSFPYPRNGIVKLDFEYILLFKKPGIAPSVSLEQKQDSKMTQEEWNTYFSGHWHFNGSKQDRHIAMFPEELPRRLIKMFSFVGETVLDPFMGSGTTGLAAKNLGRNSIGYEINRDYVLIIKEKIGQDTLYSQTDIVLIDQDMTKGIQNEYDSLPYIFKDSTKIGKKVDIKKLQFGSKIDSHSPSHREDLFSVQAIISPILISLDNGLTIHLIGIKQNDDTCENAISFLNNTIRGKRVFLKYDDTKYDSDGNLLAYMHLENKTFVNAHLLKKKLATVDNSIEYKYKDKFNSLWQKNGY